MKLLNEYYNDCILDKESKLLLIFNSIKFSFISLFFLMTFSDFNSLNAFKKKFNRYSFNRNDNKKSELNKICHNLSEKAIHYLKKNHKNGTWMDNPGITALCLEGILKSPVYINSKRDPIIKDSISYILKMQDSDGAIYDKNSRNAAKNYITALSILALAATKDPKFKNVIQKAKNYLFKIQADEEEGYDPKEDYFYGGIGYGGDERPDLSNTHLAIEALIAAGVKPDDPHLQKALIFLNRCQDGEYNDLPWAKGGTWGFAYSPNKESKKTKSKEIIPYGSMTFAGLKSLIFCNVKRDDPRVVGALGWIRKNFDVKNHPGMGQISIYYYYYVLAKTLNMMEIDELKIGNGVVVNWRKALLDELQKRQKSDGSWKNQNKKYFEGMPILATAYALNSLSCIYKRN